MLWLFIQQRQHGHLVTAASMLTVVLIMAGSDHRSSLQFFGLAASSAIAQAVEASVSEPLETAADRGPEASEGNDSPEQETMRLQEATRLPSATPEETVERFVRECVRITPGSGMFPAIMKTKSRRNGKAGDAVSDVEIKQAFRISRYETTQELYQAVMAKNPSRWKGPRNSAESMTLQDSLDFCKRLTEMLHSRKLIDIGEYVRLPEPLEWEYCCRAGTQTQFHFGEDAGRPGDVLPQASVLDAYAWHTGNAAGNDPAVGVLKPNAWGLFDMHGYLSEFTVEASGESSKREQNKASDVKSDAASSGSCMLRGGSWKDAAGELAVEFEKPFPAGSVSDAAGFRCVIAEKPSGE